jgi:hypothetical protein
MSARGPGELCQPTHSLAPSQGLKRGVGVSTPWHVALFQNSTRTDDVYIKTAATTTSLAHADASLVSQHTPEIHRRVPDALPDPSHHLGQPDVVNILRRNHLEADRFVVLNDRVAHEFLPDATVDAAVADEALLVRDVEVAAVRDARLRGRRAVARVARVKVRVEVDDGDGAVDLVERAQDREDDRMVTAQTLYAHVRLGHAYTERQNIRDDSRMSPPVLRQYARHVEPAIRDLCNGARE